MQAVTACAGLQGKPNGFCLVVVDGVLLCPIFKQHATIRYCVFAVYNSDIRTHQNSVTLVFSNDVTSLMILSMSRHIEHHNQTKSISH